MKVHVLLYSNNSSLDSNPTKDDSKDNLDADLSLSDENSNSPPAKRLKPDLLSQDLTNQESSGVSDDDEWDDNAAAMLDDLI